MDDDDTKPIKGPINDPVNDPVGGDDTTVPDPNADEILEEDRLSKDPNESTLQTQPKLPQDFDSPAASQDDPVTRNLPADHPAMDSDMDKTDVYESDETDASNYWAEHESNDRTNDAFLGDNGPDL